MERKNHLDARDKRKKATNKEKEKEVKDKNL